MKLLLKISMVIMTITLWCCNKKESVADATLASKWADMATYITKNTPANSPTYASRCLGYIGLTMYESVVAGYPDYQSLQKQLNNMPELPKIEANKSYNWQLSFNAAEAEIIKSIYAQTSDENKVKIDSLEKVADRETGTIETFPAFPEKSEPT